MWSQNWTKKVLVVWEITEYIEKKSNEKTVKRDEILDRLRDEEGI